MDMFTIADGLDAPWANVANEDNLPQDILDVPITEITDDWLEILDYWTIRGGRHAFLLVDRFEVDFNDIAFNLGDNLIKDELSFSLNEDASHSYIGNELINYYDVKFPLNAIVYAGQHVSSDSVDGDSFDCYGLHNMYSIPTVLKMIDSIRQRVQHYHDTPKEEQSPTDSYIELDQEMEYIRQIACRLKGLLATIEPGYEGCYCLSVSGP